LQLSFDVAITSVKGINFVMVVSPYKKVIAFDEMITQIYF